jgi:hypothetical protein
VKDQDFIPEALTEMELTVTFEVTGDDWLTVRVYDFLCAKDLARLAQEVANEHRRHLSDVHIRFAVDWG